MTETTMRAETLHAANCVEQQIQSLGPQIAALVKKLKQKPPHMVVCCARGSSDHAGVYARYLIETSLGIPTASATPSTLSVYGKQPQLKNALVIVISQSGRSPDLIEYCESAQKAGATTIGLINCAEDAPLSQYCDAVLPLGAGPENAVAATKSYITTLTAALQLTAHWSDNHELQAQILALPQHLRKATTLSWNDAVPHLAPANNMLVLGRGPGLGIAREAALKFKETCALHAESFSAAEVLHGPLAMIRPGFPVLVFDQNDLADNSINQTLDRLSQAGAKLLLATENDSMTDAIHLPVLKNLHPWIAPITRIQTCYLMFETLAYARGMNADNPSHIAKVTHTR